MQWNGLTSGTKIHGRRGEAGAWHEPAGAPGMRCFLLWKEGSTTYIVRYLWEAWGHYFPFIQSKRSPISQSTQSKWFVSWLLLPSSLLPSPMPRPSLLRQSFTIPPFALQVQREMPMLTSTTLSLVSRMNVKLAWYCTFVNQTCSLILTSCLVLQIWLPVLTLPALLLVSRVYAKHEAWENNCTFPGLFHYL